MSFSPFLKGLIAGSALVLVAIVVLFSTYTIKTVHGNEVGVMETWEKGVLPDSLPPKTYFYNKWTESIYTYQTSGQVYAMNDKEEPFAEGRRVDPLVINSKDNQQVVFHIIVTWRIDPKYVVDLHKHYRNNIEERLLRPSIVKAMSVRGTLQDAIDLYSGPTLNQLRTDVEHDLRDALHPNGIEVDSFVIEKPTFLNKEYVDNIERRQVQIIVQSRAHEEQLANDALALAEKAKAQIDLNTRVVAAEAAKQVAIKEQEAKAQMAIVQTNADAQNTVTKQKAESEKIVIAAKAEADRLIAVSEGNRQSQINTANGARDAEIARAVGIRAVGESTALANKLLLESYSVAGSDNYTRIQVADKFANAMSAVRYYPPNATFNTIASDFSHGLSLLATPSGATALTVPIATGTP
jgi:regulator of protease activity HflC (stomatin/prohibitin superfamily)